VVKWWDWLQSRGAPRPEKVVAMAAARTRGRDEMWSRFALGLIPLLAFGTLAAAQFAVPGLMGLSATPAPPYRFDQAVALQEPDLPETVGELQRVGFERHQRESGDIFGEYSRSYRYRDSDGQEYVVSCDFPFGPHWHDLRVCYTGAGWTVADTRPKSNLLSGPDGWGYIQVDFAKPDGTAGLLTYCVMDERGQYVEPPSGSLVGDTWRSFRKHYDEKQSARQFQIQVFTTAPGRVNEKQAATALELLQAARAQFYKLITEPRAAASGAAP
jgi:hypothetical protein